MNNHRQIPSDQFQRVVDEMRIFSNLIDEQQGHMTTARGVNAIEARRCLMVSAERLREAGFWFNHAMGEARKAGMLVERAGVVRPEPDES